MNPKQLIDECGDEDLIMVNGFDDAIVGLANGWFPTNSEGVNHAVVVAYDVNRCIQILQSQGMSEDEAVEYFEFNVAGAYVGPHTPIFITFLS